MAEQYIFAAPYSTSALGTVAMLGRRRIIQRRKGGKELRQPIIPHWAGQATLIGGRAPVSRPVYDAISEMFTDQTGLALPTSRDAAEFSIVHNATGTAAYVLPVPVSESELTTMIRAINIAIDGLTVADGLFEEMLATSTLALDEVLHPTEVPQGGWGPYMYRNYFQDYRPGPLDRLPPIIQSQLTRYSQQSPEFFRLGLETLPEAPITVTLTGITVVGATADPTSGTYYTPYQREGIVQLSATTSSSDPLAAQLVAWEVDGREAGTGARLTLTTDQMTAQGAPMVITARLGSSEQRVTLAVRPEFERFWIEGAAQVEVLDNDQRLRASAPYGADADPVLVRLSLRPDTPEAYSFVTWTGGEKISGHSDDRRAVSRRRVTAKDAPVKVTARLNPVFEADVEVLPTLTGLLADGEAVPENGRVEVVYSTDPDRRVQLRAVTTPDNEEAWSHLVWTGGTAGLTANLRSVPLDGVLPGAGPITVTVGIGAGPVTTVQIVMLPRLVAIEPIGMAESTGDGTARAFRGNGPPCILQLRTEPADAAGLPAIQWSGNVVPWRSLATRALRRDGDHDEVVTVTARIGGQQAQLAVSLAAPVPPTDMGLAPASVTFANTTDLYDDDDDPIDQVWETGFASPPESFPRATTIRLSAEFTLDPRPAANSRITLRGTAWVPLIGGGVTLMRWTSGAIDVPTAGPTPDTVTLAETDASAPLANEVSYQSRANATAALAEQRWPLQILWEVRPAAGGEWRQIGTTDHPTYVMQAAPAGGCQYFQTSFDIACRNADGARNAAEAIAGSYAAFEARDPVNGDNPQVQRSSDDLELSYWLNGSPAQNLAGLLASTLGNGSCLAFSQLLEDMLLSQGIATADCVQVVPNTTLAPDAEAFAVARWRFTPPTTPAGFANWNYTRQAGGAPNTCNWAGGPGQNQPNPPPLFLNHFIIENGGSYYDPSYGTAVQNSFEAWSRVSIAGLERNPLPDIGYAGPPPLGTAVTEEA